MDVGLGHGSHDPRTDVTGDDPIFTGKIALAHMKEFPDYYERLGWMEREAERDWLRSAALPRSPDRSGRRALGPQRGRVLERRVVSSSGGLLPCMYLFVARARISDLA
jgi:hypothetical protein